MDFKGQTFLFLGKSGAGKDSQADWLESYLRSKKYKILRVSTGDLARKLAQKDSLIGQWMRGILKKGGFFPFWAQVGLWFRLLEKHLEKNTVVIFPSSPRRLEEAGALDSLMSSLGRPLPIPVYLDITDDEAKRRLLRRKRNDDKLAAIKERLENFRRNVAPVIKDYKRRIVRVDGSGTKEEVWKRIIKKLN